MKLILTILFISFFYAQNIRIRHLANEGVWIESPAINLIIDGLFKNEYKQFDVLDEFNLKTITESSEEFPIAKLILSSHLHGDHYNAQLVGEYLLNHKKSQFISNNSVVKNFRNNFNNFDAVEKRVQAISPAMGGRLKMQISGIDLTILRLPHLGGEKMAKIESIAFLIELAGKKIIHFGDCELTTESLAKFSQLFSDIDVVILPFWHFLNDEQQAFIKETIQSKSYILSHVNLEHMKSIEDKFSDIEDVVVFTEFNEGLNLEDD